MKNHEEIQGLLAAYALDALDSDELALVQAHLSSCAACRRELASYLRVTDAMALRAAEGSAPPSPPPSVLEQRIIREASLVKARTSLGRARRWNRGFAVAAAALILLLAGGNVAQWTSSLQFQARTRGLVTVALTGVGSHHDAYGTIVVDLDDSEGVLAVCGLSKLGPGWRYQLWLKKDGATMSGGLFSVNDDGYGSLLIKVPGGFKDFRTFGISIEPAEGSVVPQGPRVLAGGL